MTSVNKADPDLERWFAAGSEQRPAELAIDGLGDEDFEAIEPEIEAEAARVAKESGGIDPPDPAGVSRQDEIRHSRFSDGASFILDGDDDHVSLWGEGQDIAWAKGEGLLVVGPPGIAKSTLMQQLALRRAGVLDGPLLGWPVEPSSSSVLYLAMDRPKQIQRSMRRMVGEEHREVLAERVIVWKGPPPADLAGDPGQLLRMMFASGAGSVFIDSLKDAAIGLSEDAVGAGINRAFQLVLAENFELVGAHHQRKAQQGGGKPNTLDDVYGSTWITSGAGSVILLWGTPGDSIVELSHLKTPAEVLGPFKVAIDFETGSVMIEDEIDLVALALSSSNGLTVKSAACAIFGTTTPDRNQIEKARRRLDRHPGLTRTEGTPPSGGGKPPVIFRASAGTG